MLVMLPVWCFHLVCATIKSLVPRLVIPSRSVTALIVTVEECTVIHVCDVPQVTLASYCSQKISAADSGHTFG